MHVHRTYIETKANEKFKTEFVKKFFFSTTDGQTVLKKPFFRILRIGMWTFVEKSGRKILRKSNTSVLTCDENVKN